MCSDRAATHTNILKPLAKYLTGNASICSSFAKPGNAEKPFERDSETITPPLPPVASTRKSKAPLHRGPLVPLLPATLLLVLSAPATPRTTRIPA
jgi:hypothetical protein